MDELYSIFLESIDYSKKYNPKKINQIARDLVTNAKYFGFTGVSAEELVAKYESEK